MVTTSEVETLLAEHNLLLPSPVKNREKFLPTKDQLIVNISFLLASEKCKGVKSWEMVWAAPKRSVCLSEQFKEIEPQVKQWAKENPEAFHKLYERVVWKGWYGEAPV
jgi:hypothetical protein